MQRLGLLIICLMLCLVACGGQSEKTVEAIASPASIPSSTATVTASVTLPATLTSTLSPTNRPSLTHTPKKTSTPLSSPSPDINVLKVSLIDPNNLGADIFLETVSWSDDGKTIYYSFSSPTDGSYEKSLQWLAYDIQTRVSTTLTDTPMIDRNIILPLHVHGFYPELRGITSPSGRYTFKEISNESSQTTEIWLRDRVTQKDTKLVETFPGYIYTAEWFRDETQVILDIAYQEYGGISYLINIQTGIAEPLCQPDDLHCWTVEERLTLSPDDSMVAGLALERGKFQIRIDSLIDRTSTYIRESASQLTWSFDGRLLYYWLGIPWAGDPLTQLRAYDTTTGTNSTVIDIIDLNERGVCLIDCYFDVSPDSKLFVFWNRIDKGFWIVTFPVTPSEISNTPTHTYKSPFSALPPGQYLLYWAYEKTGLSTLYATSYDESQVRMMMEVDIPGVFSSDMTMLALTDQYDALGHTQLIVKNLSDSTIITIPNSQGCQHPSWSPDAKKLVAQCTGEIVVFFLENNDQVVIAKEINQLDTPVWSPDGKWIAYFNRPTITVSPEDGLYIADVSCIFSNPICQINTMGPFIEALNPPISWSPDSQYLVTVTKTSISILDFQKGESRKLVEIEDSFYPEAVTWSHDGKYIAYDIFGQNVYIVDALNGALVSRLYPPPQSFQIITWIVIPHPFAPGDTYTITDAGADLNLRSEPSQDGVILRKLQPGDTVTILDGPVEADGYTWWQMQADDGATGWAVNIPEWYEAVEE